jgi:hypothetical protein
MRPGTKTTQAHSDSRSAGAILSSFVRLRIVAALCCGLIAAAAALPAAAQQGYGGYRPYLQWQGPGQGQGQGPGPQRGADRPPPQRDTRGAPEGDRGRMSPDERRQLRRDIQDAGKDIYHPARQGSPAPRRNGRR